MSMTVAIVFKLLLSQYDSNLSSIKSVHGPNRKGDIPHSLASIEKAQRLLDYKPLFSLKSGLEATVKWYWDHKSSLEV